MIYIVDNILNYIIYLFILSCGFRLRPRKNKFLLGASVLAVLLAGAFNAYFDTNSPITYIVWSMLSISLFYEERPGRLAVLSAALMYFTGIIDTFSVMLLQIVLIGGGIADTGIAWWMEPAYLISFLVYLLVYFRLLKKNEVFLCDIGLKYRLAILIQGGIFQTFYDFVFVSFNESHAMYGWDAYVVFFVSLAGALYSIFLTLGLAIQNRLSARQNRTLQSLMQMQRQQYDYQLQQSVSLRRFKHDLVNHMGVLRELVNQEKAEEAKEYIDAIWNIQNEFGLKLHTGDGFLDVIINYYQYLAAKEKIEFAVSGKLAGKLPLTMFDLTTLMGNILQNAMESAVKAAVPKIRVTLMEHGKEFFIIVSNSAAQKINTGKGIMKTSKKDRENHGFGLKNIAAAVEKYHGEFYMESIEENGEALFQVSIAVPKESRV